MIVYLVPAGRERFEIYSEAPEEPAAEPDAGAGALQRWMHRVGVRWHRLVEQARLGGGHGRFARGRDRFICRLAENIAEQRTLWRLRDGRDATLRYQTTCTSAAARRTLNDILAHARRHHGRWLIVDIVLAVASGLLAIIPGPNLLAYYFLFRLVGHLQSWRGARHALSTTTWSFDPSDDLEELATLVHVSRAARAGRVDAIAERLECPRLPAFFDRVAVTYDDGAR